MRNSHYLRKKICSTRKRGPKNQRNPNLRRKTKRGTRRKKGLKMDHRRKKYKRMNCLGNQDEERSEKEEGSLEKKKGPKTS